MRTMASAAWVRPAVGAGRNPPPVTATISASLARLAMAWALPVNAEPRRE